MVFVLGQESRNNLATVDPKLRRVVERAIQITEVDFKVIEGVRTKLRQYQLYAQGRTIAQLRKAGVPATVLAQPGKDTVTWTLNSRHFPDPKTGLSRAVDCAPFPISWATTPENLARFDAVARAMFEAAREQSARLRWGADWDMDGRPRERGETDSPHFELA